MPIGVRVTVMVLAWLPLVAMYFAMSIPVPIEGMIAGLVATVALIAVAAAVSVSVVSAWIREVRGDDEAAQPIAPAGQPTTFAFSQQSRGSAAVLFAGLVLLMLAQQIIRRGRVDLVFVTGITLLFSATFALITWRGRYYVDVFDDRIRCQEAFWRSRDELESREGFPIDGVTRVVLERGWGNWGFAPVVVIYADSTGTADSACVPLGQSDRRQGLRCLDRILEAVAKESVDPGVLPLKSALETLEASSDRPSEAALADRALRLVSRDKLEEAAALLDSASSSAELRRAGSELAEAVRVSAESETCGETR